ncbi:MAG: histidine phosphatase family protein [Pseudomonadota bacterium]|nr:histidine phosphatase family protein [Pseudomonadota bacterium]
MRQLLLLRHAKSSWDDRELPDHERPLNPRGRRAAAAMRDAMDHLGLVPDLVLLSTSVRTVQTLEALEPWAETPLVDRMEALYNASASTLLDTVRAVKETVRSVLVIAHNPGIHELANILVGARARNDGLANPDIRRLRDGYPSGALTEFTIAGPWHGLGEGGGRLVRFICPRDFAAEHASGPE